MDAVETLPWPDVNECHGHLDRWASCKQCNGQHDHVWVALVIHGGVMAAVAVRCEVCGGRKCDVVDCIERRHHQGPHMNPQGAMRAVGR